jgi:hypothetical protein
MNPEIPEIRNFLQKELGLTVFDTDSAEGLFDLGRIALRAPGDATIIMRSLIVPLIAKTCDRGCISQD